MNTFERRYKTNAAAELDGIEADLGDGLKIRVARNGNERHVRALARMMEPYRGTTIAESVEEEIEVKAMAEAILVGWTGAVNEDGTPLEYSLAAAEGALRIKDFRAVVRRISLNLERFLAANVEAIRKN